MSAENEPRPRPPLTAEPSECRRLAETLAREAGDGVATATAWAVLAVAGELRSLVRELHDIGRTLGKGR